jgi:flagellar hook assembly protein FlgD
MAPNPSTGPATVEFTLPRGAFATVALYDIAGRRIRGLASGDYAAGTQRLAWDGLDDRGRAVPAGNYRVRIAALGFVESRSCVRLR